MDTKLTECGAHTLTVTNSVQQTGVTRIEIQWQGDIPTIPQYPGKGKAKIHPRTGHDGPEGGIKGIAPLFL